MAPAKTSHTLALKTHNPEDEIRLLAWVVYLGTLIDDLVAQGISTKRIVLGGSWQGYAVALAMRLVSLRGKEGLEVMNCFSTRGSGNQAVSRRYQRLFWAWGRRSDADGGMRR